MLSIVIRESLNEKKMLKKLRRSRNALRRKLNVRLKRRLNARLRKKKLYVWQKKKKGDKLQ